jgi:hypothetical protein
MVQFAHLPGKHTFLQNNPLGMVIYDPRSIYQNNKCFFPYILSHTLLRNVCVPQEEGVGLLGIGKGGTDRRGLGHVRLSHLL